MRNEKHECVKLTTFFTSLDELDLVRFDMDFGVGGIFLGVFVLLSPAQSNNVHPIWEVD